MGSFLFSSTDSALFLPPSLPSILPLFLFLFGCFMRIWREAAVYGLQGLRFRVKHICVHLLVLLFTACMATVPCTAQGLLPEIITSTSSGVVKTQDDDGKTITMVPSTQLAFSDWQLFCHCCCWQVVLYYTTFAILLEAMNLFTFFLIVKGIWSFLACKLFGNTCLKISSIMVLFGSLSFKCHLRVQCTQPCGHMKSLTAALCEFR